jgi:hypothetical protein
MPEDVQQKIGQEMQQPDIEQEEPIKQTQPLTMESDPSEFDTKEIDFMKQAKAQ